MDNLDEIEDRLASEFRVSSSTRVYNSYKAMCKRKTCHQSQEERRILFLQNLKQKRQECLLKIRKLTGIELENEDIFYDASESHNTTNLALCFNQNDQPFEDLSDDSRFSQSSQPENKSNQRRRRQKQSKAKEGKSHAILQEECMESDSPEIQRSDELKKKPVSPYKDQLMLSEWMYEKPSDLKENWLLVICPVGKRCLVISSNGQTRVYSRSGHFMKAFPAHLPGGNRRDSAFRQSAILDCIFVEVEKTFYILDVIRWNQTSFYDSETELRFYWLSTKVKEEYSHVSTPSQLNPNKFLLLEHFKCNKDTIVSAVQSYPYKPKIDGLLFFHKKCHYYPEVTPLVCWLKLDMIKDVLGFEVNVGNQMDWEIES